MNNNILSYISKWYKTEILTIEPKKKRLKVSLTNDLKEFFREYNIKNEFDLLDNLDLFREKFLSDEICYCANNDDLYPCSLEMNSQAPIFGIGEAPLSPFSVSRVAFLYDDYNLNDWIEQLTKKKKVYFSFFIDNAECYNGTNKNFKNGYLKD
ncbi:hypothetical protein H2274_07160 [Campylobacter sp. W0049]|uniref:hypothetical protein n=1 Tax=Campylobacter molothri TaxID=1032242 RepID=UPI00301E54D2|nr:hypothetical protein [Campylobacter sp. W0049]